MPRFVRGMVKSLKFLYANPEEAAEIAKKQFPTMPLEDLKATLERSFADGLWSQDGRSAAPRGIPPSPSSWPPAFSKVDVKYEEIIDMSFVDSLRS